MDKDESFEILIEKVKQLSPENQKAIIFLIKNFDIVKKMCENSEMTDEEIQKKIAIAKEKHDHIMLALLTAAQVFNEKYPDCTKMPPSDAGGGTAQP